MNQDNIDKRILLAWVWFTVKFLFFSYWEILFWPLIILLLDGSRHGNTLDEEQMPGDMDPRAFGHTTKEHCKIRDQYKHLASLDRLIRKLIEEEKEIILRKHQEKFIDLKK
ncbi:hypothetical protein TNCV_1756701 [Trichonephila clavipes]|nr:hypothetical protein TNCV_1756701 [Trichonephila clavipes]